MSKGLIIFDFDGTLGDTRRNIVTTMQMTIEELHLPPTNQWCGGAGEEVASSAHALGSAALLCKELQLQATAICQSHYLSSQGKQKIRNMKEINYKDMKFNPFNLIGGEWMLVTAENEQSGCNTMTASWGHLGCLWGHNDPTAVIYLRPSRYTKKFVDEEPYFTLCVMDKSFKKQMAYLGSVSGRDEDIGKIEKVLVRDNEYLK